MRDRLFVAASCGCTFVDERMANGMHVDEGGLFGFLFSGIIRRKRNINTPFL